MGKEKKLGKHAGDKLNGLLPYINVFLFITILFIVVYRLGIHQYVKIIQGFMLAGVLFSLAGLGIYSLRKGYSWNTAVKVFIAIGVIMRIGYMLYTPYTTRAIDLGDSSLDGYGHAAYILKLLINGHLPETNWVQFYHPPFFHGTAAAVCFFVNKIMEYSKYEDILQIAKIVSCTAACWSLMLLPKICQELKLSAKAGGIATGIIAVLPSCYLMSARVNNDALVTYFMILAILYTIRWYKAQNWENTICLGLAFGLGMMTKTSCGNIAIFTGALMLYVAYKKFKEKKGKDIVYKLLGFGAIAFPLGLWYTVRNYILFAQPFGYVVRIGTDQRIYTGDVSFIKRFLTFPVRELFQPIYSNPWEEYNVSMFVMKSSLFSEFEFDIAAIIPRILIALNCGMILLALGAMGYVIIKFKENKLLSKGMPVLWAIIYITFLYFNMEYPFGCTMDFRYIVPTAFLGAIFIGSVFEKACNRKTKKAVLCRVTIGTVTMLFGICSILMFCMIGQ